MRSPAFAPRPTLPPKFDPETILTTLVDHGVDFIVIGALAAYLQGSPLPTLDVDITPKPDPDNLERLWAALTEIDAKIRSEGTEPLPFSHNARSLAAADTWNLSTRYGDLDITRTPAGTGGYDDLSQEAITVRIGDSRVRLASLADVIRSKEAAGRDKDRRALPVLRELLSRQIRRHSGG